HKLGTVGRPAEFAVWLKNYRQYDKDPQIKSVEKFAQKWRVWWTQLQPRARIPSTDPAWPLLRVNGLDWSLTRRGGNNGFLVIILTLAWW
ncbi:hypothetical protein BD410DRAFT_699483, partial [Rickenella mellea]